MTFPDDVVILRAAGADEYGNPHASWDAPTETPAKSFITRSKALFPPGTDVRDGDRIRWGPLLFTVSEAGSVRSTRRTVLVSAVITRVES